MLERIALHSLFALALISAAATADAVAGDTGIEDGKAAAPSHRKAYDALFSDIIKGLPGEGLSKVDSARGGNDKRVADHSTKAASVDELKKDAVEKRKKEMEELSPEVKARVDKVLSGLDNRRREKQVEFKEISE